MTRIDTALLVVTVAVLLGLLFVFVVLPRLLSSLLFLLLPLLFALFVVLLTLPLLWVFPVNWFNIDMRVRVVCMCVCVFFFVLCLFSFTLMHAWLPHIAYIASLYHSLNTAYCVLLFGVVVIVIYVDGSCVVVAVAVVVVNIHGVVGIVGC